MLLDALEKEGVLDDLVIIISSDHGENLGELNVYGDHQTADHITSRVPLIIRWPGLTRPRVDHGLYYQSDLAATVTQLVGGECSPRWDGRSFADAFRKGETAGRDCLVLSQCAWSCQRSVREGDTIAIRTYHDGLKSFPQWMLFDLKADPHETRNLAEERPDVVERAQTILDRWHAEMMSSSVRSIDPLDVVLAEGGPFHTRGMLAPYVSHLKATGRPQHADALERRHGTRGVQQA